MFLKMFLKKSDTYTRDINPSSSSRSKYLMKQCLSLDFSCFQVVLLADWLRDVSLHSMSPLNQVVDQGDKHC